MLNENRYIDITSGVGASASAGTRSLEMRLITQNASISPGIVMRFTNADDVSTIFGNTSEEYLRSTAYFSFISKSILSPTAISFTRWVSVAIPAMIVGDSTVKTLANFTAISAGTLSIMSDGTSVSITGIDLSTATNLTDVATLIQTALRASSDPQLATASTVTYNTNTNQYVLSGASNGAGTLSVVATGTSGDLSQLLGWATSGTVLVTGNAAESALTAFQNSVQIDNNFGTAIYCTPSTPLTNDDIVAIAQYNYSLNNNYVYSTTVLPSTYSAIYALVKGYGGTALSLLSATLPNDYVEQCPAEIAAATDYTRNNSNQNYMYYQFANRNVVLNSSTSDDTLANALDAAHVNYIGATQVNGQSLAFYQTGILCGGSDDAVDMNIYYNEIWLKSDITTTYFDMFLNLPIVPASTDGQALVATNLQTVINQAKTNGTITVGKALTTIQQQYITTISGDPNAWRQVQTIGYWFNVQVQSFTNSNNGLTQYEAAYTLIYSKGDAIRKIIGTDILI